MATIAAQHHPHTLARRLELLRRRLYPLVHPIRTKPANLARELEATHAAALAAAATNPELLADIHAYLDVDDDTAYPWPGVAHPTGGTL